MEKEILKKLEKIIREINDIVFNIQLFCPINQNKTNDYDKGVRHACLDILDSIYREFHHYLDKENDNE